jgi:hypothetical protein
MPFTQRPTERGPFSLDSGKMTVNDGARVEEVQER